MAFTAFVLSLTLAQGVNAKTIQVTALEASELEEPQWFVEISSDGNESEKERCALR